MQTLIETPSSQSRLALDAKPVGMQTPPDAWFKMSPIQQMYLDRATGDDAKFIHHAFFRLSRHVPPSQIGSAIIQLGHRHPMLRARFERNSNGDWRQRVLDDVQDTIGFHKHHIGQWEDSTMWKAVEDSKMALDITEGPLTIVDIFETSTSQQYLSITAHHLILDLVSWRILVQDLETALAVGVDLGPVPPVTFKEWCLKQEQFAIHHLDPEVALPVEVPSIPGSYWGHMALEHNTFADSEHQWFIIDEEVTAFILGPAQNLLNCEPPVIIHAALLYSFALVFEDRPLPTIFTEGHGREPWDDCLDLSQTVGWFTTIYPIVVQPPSDSSLWEFLTTTQKARANVPHNGWAYFASRFLNPKGREVFKNHTPIEILFNYTGTFRQLEHSDRLLQPTVAPGQSAFLGATNLQRFDLVDINVAPFNGRLVFDIMVNRHMQHMSKIRDWFDKFRQLLAKIPEDCEQFSSNKRTAADFPLLSMSDTQLSALIEQVTSRYRVAPSEIEDIYPCSPIQQGILLSQIKNPSLYQARWTWTVKPNIASSLHMDQIQQAWKKVVAHHAILRTVFVDSVGQESAWSQVVLKSMPHNIIVVENNEDWTADTQSGFLAPDDSSNHRLIVTQRSPCAITCRLEINHALFDATTMSLLMRDFQRAYDNLLPSIPAVPYSSYISYLDQLPHAAASSYWVRQCDGLPPSILPGMATPHSTKNHSRRPKSFLTELPEWADLSSFCKSHGITAATLLQAAWSLTLRTYTGGSTACFGYPTAGRDIPVTGIQDLAGPLINLLPCSLHIKSDSVLSVLREHQDSFVRGMQYQHISLPDVLHALGWSREPLFNTALSVVYDSIDDPISSTVSLEFESVNDPTEVIICFPELVRDSGLTDILIV
ncbi:hypothetical protein N7512_004663 [Penicillium capsulatum]|nr:hypothetical protein N7512_004663 [Penicillium capsulatum]